MLQFFVHALVIEIVSFCVVIVPNIFIFRCPGNAVLHYYGFSYVTSLELICPLGC